VEVKAKKVEPISTHIHNTGFGGMERQFQDVHDLFDCLQGDFGVPLGATDDYKVICIANQFSE
jgi:hypothetical protein